MYSAISRNLPKVRIFVFSTLAICYSLPSLIGPTDIDQPQRGHGQQPITQLCRPSATNQKQTFRDVSTLGRRQTFDRCGPPAQPTIPTKFTLLSRESSAYKAFPCLQRKTIRTLVLATDESQPKEEGRDGDVVLSLVGPPQVTWLERRQQICRVVFLTYT